MKEITVPKASECPEVALAWELHDKIKEVVDRRSGGDPLGRRYFELDGYKFEFNTMGLTRVNDTQGRFVRPDPVDADKVFGCYIDQAPGTAIQALAYDMPDPDYCRRVITPLLERELVLDRLAEV